MCSQPLAVNRVEDVAPACGCTGCRWPLGTVAHQKLAGDCLDCRRWQAHVGSLPVLEGSGPVDFRGEAVS